MKKTNRMSKVWTLSLVTLLVFSQSFPANALTRASSPAKSIITSKVYYNNQLQNAFNEQFKAPSLHVQAPRSYYPENLKSAWEKFEKKKDVVVAVIDTGIDSTHPFIKDNIYVASGTVSSQNYGMDFSQKKTTTTPNDEHGHGTHVAGIIKSVFPEVKILPLKYFNPAASGQDNLNATIKALEYAVSQHVDIINYSGGGPEASEEEYKILKRAEDLGILVVAAAGNEESDIDKKKNAYYPASYGLSNIITVTAHNQSLKALESSNWGIKSVDVSAPGFRIKSSIPQGKAGYMSGTSQATAFASGVAALIKSQYTKLSAQEIKTIITQSAVKDSGLFLRCQSGGRLDADEAIKMAANYSNSDPKNRIFNDNKLAKTSKQNNTAPSDLNLKYLRVNATN